jgi:hypothetical protein
MLKADDIDKAKKIRFGKDHLPKNIKNVSKVLAVPQRRYQAGTHNPFAADGNKQLLHWYCLPGCPGGFDVRNMQTPGA